MQINVPEYGQQQELSQVSAVKPDWHRLYSIGTDVRHHVRDARVDVRFEALNVSLHADGGHQITKAHA